jgi:hypothetical protein
VTRWPGAAPAATSCRPAIYTMSRAEPSRPNGCSPGSGARPGLAILVESREDELRYCLNRSCDPSPPRVAQSSGPPTTIISSCTRVVGSASLRNARCWAWRNKRIEILFSEADVGSRPLWVRTLSTGQSVSRRPQPVSRPRPVTFPKASFALSRTSVVGALFALAERPKHARGPTSPAPATP